MPDFLPKRGGGTSAKSDNRLSHHLSFYPSQLSCCHQMIFASIFHFVKNSTKNLHNYKNSQIYHFSTTLYHMWLVKHPLYLCFSLACTKPSEAKTKTATEKAWYRLSLLSLCRYSWSKLTNLEKWLSYRLILSPLLCWEWTESQTMSDSEPIYGVDFLH